MTDSFACALCLELTSEYGTEDHFVSTECGHIYHYLCLKPSYESGYNFCPICKKPMDLENLRKLYGLEPKVKKKKTKTFPRSFQLTPTPSAQVPDQESKKEPDYKFKIIMVGDAGVGKSSLLQRYSDGIYDCNLFTTVGCDWRSKSMFVGGRSITLSIWDTVGQEKYRSLITNYVRDSHGALICYDITNEDSFSQIEEFWYDYVKDNGLKDCVKILVGTKADLDEHRQVPKTKGKELAQRLRMPFFETSAKDAYNVEAAFRTLAAKILETDSLLKEIEYRRTQVGTLRLSREQTAASSPIEAACSYSWHWTKSGVISMAKGVRNGWNAISPSS